MHQESHQDARHSNQNGVMVHALQAWGEGGREELPHAPTTGGQGPPGERQHPLPIIPTEGQAKPRGCQAWVS